ncbi:SHOCT domain-containing protein [Sanguibacter inulinus]|uniref:SHOCT domain-containing protein n=1 Tax=Sanguibacter inulinus TaxID=60922 RepID=A0A853ENF8_9MICO|nr:SHOCT domain-containing protein [Sanguibacter inulinus]MBF0720936.1 SHOCT domain-containing protein [Sanguibacter inulinus]NYS92081.1 SHOCT domain-containing protein [Sanguibacter inulinus]
MSFWNVVWLIFVSFVFISYLFILFAVVRDIFRENKHSGVWKAVWLVFLVFVPFLTALVYMVLHSRDIAENDAKAAAAAQREVDSYIRQAAGRNPAAEIATGAQLLADGTITQEEFETLKARSLAASA